MKISSEYAKAFHTLQNRLKRDFPKTKDTNLESLPPNGTEMLLLGILATNETYDHAREALKTIKSTMVDFNELRVTPVAEIAELIDRYIGDAQSAAKAIVIALNWLFSRFDTLDLTELKEKNKGEITKLFEEIPSCPDHARCAMLLFCFDIAEMPLDDLMLKYLISDESLPAEVDLPTAKGFIERQLKAAEFGSFYWQLRKASEVNIEKLKKK
jgi:hypothetical protein